MKFSDTNPPCTQEDIDRFMRGVDEEAAWMHDAPVDAYLEIERMTEEPGSK